MKAEFLILTHALFLPVLPSFPKFTYYFSWEGLISACDTTLSRQCHCERSRQLGTPAPQASVNLQAEPSLTMPTLQNSWALSPFTFHSCKTGFQITMLKKEGGGGGKELASGFLSDAIVLWNSRPAFKLFAVSTTNSYFLKKRI